MAERAQLSLPSGNGLCPLPSTIWRSWEVGQALAEGNPGAVVAAARRAHGLNQAQLGALAGFSQSAISRLESGGNLAFDLRMLRVFQRVLGIPPQLLGLAAESFPVPVADAGRLLPPFETTRQDVTVAIDLNTLTSACTAAIASALPAYAAGPVDPDVIRRLLVVRRLLNDSDNWLGSGDLAGTVRRLYELIGRVRRESTGALRQRLLGVAALYAEFCGWLHQEVGDRAGAAEWTDRALQQALAADDRELVSYVCVRLGQLAAADRDGDRVVGLARAAQREGGLSAGVRALALQEEARGHALVGSERDCLATLDEARTMIATVAGEEHAQPADEYRIGYYFDSNHLTAESGACLLELGRATDAIEAYRTGARSLARLCHWERGVHLAKLAQAYAMTGDAERAGTAGWAALSVARETGSVLVTDQLRRLAPWHDQPALAGLLKAIDRAR